MDQTTFSPSPHGDLSLITLYSEGPSLGFHKHWGVWRAGAIWASSGFGEGDGEEAGKRDDVIMLLSSHSHML